MSKSYYFVTNTGRFWGRLDWIQSIGNNEPGRMSVTGKVVVKLRKGGFDASDWLAINSNLAVANKRGLVSGSSEEFKTS